MPPELRVMISEHIMGGCIRNTTSIKGPEYRAKFKAIMKIPALMHVNKSLRSDIIGHKSPYERLVVESPFPFSLVSDIFIEWATVCGKEMITSIKEITFRYIYM